MDIYYANSKFYITHTEQLTYYDPTKSEVITENLQLSCIITRIAISQKYIFIATNKNDVIIFNEGK